MNPTRQSLTEMRPAEVIWAYWEQVMVIEQDAIRLDIEYVERGE